MSGVNVTFNQLPAATAQNDTDIYAKSESPHNGNTSKKVTGTQLKTYILNGVVKSLNTTVTPDGGGNIVVTTDSVPETTSNPYYSDSRVAGYITTQKNQPNGVAGLDSGGKLVSGVIPSYVGDVKSVNSQTADGYGNVAISTTNVSEGSNLYYTNGRAQVAANGVITSLSGNANGLCPLDGSGKVSPLYLPAIAAGNYIQYETSLDFDAGSLGLHQIIPAASGYFFLPTLVLVRVVLFNQLFINTAPTISIGNNSTYDNVGVSTTLPMTPVTNDVITLAIPPSNKFIDISTDPISVAVLTEGIGYNPYGLRAYVFGILTNV